MPEFIPRSLVVITALIAAIALFIGVRDYMATKHTAHPTAIVGTQSVAQPTTVARKKGATATKRRSQASAAQKNVSPAPTTENGTDEPLIRDVLAKAEPDHKVVKAAKVQPMLNEAAFRSPSSCAPLPNSTKPRDVDALYYQGWAREYGCGLD